MATRLTAEPFRHVRFRNIRNQVPRLLGSGRVTLNEQKMSPTLDQPNHNHPPPPSPPPSPPPPTNNTATTTTTTTTPTPAPMTTPTSTGRANDEGDASVSPPPFFS